MAISRRTLITAAAASSVGSFAILPRRASAAQFTYKYGGNLPADHPTMQWAQKAADRIKEQTGGRLEIRVFPNNQLGSDTDMLSQLRSGALEFFSLAGTILSTYVPMASIDGVGFAFKSQDEVWKAMDGDLGAMIRAQIQKSNLLVMDRIWGHGFRQVTSNAGPVRTPDDLKGLKIRMPVTPLWTSMFKALGASPTSINFSETYTALQTRVVDAEENPLAVILVAKLYEVQKYLSLTNHIWGGYWFLGNRRAFEALPEDVQAVVRKVVDECCTEQRAELARLEGSFRQDLVAKGMVVNEPDVTPFREVLSKAGFYAEWRKKYGEEAWSLLERYAGKLV
jgi:tripartite ATP-independent transporter DctP family solute receptor